MFATIPANERNDRNKKLFYLDRDFEYTSIRFFLFFPFETEGGHPNRRIISIL